MKQRQNLTVVDKLGIMITILYLKFNIYSLFSFFFFY